jgi:RNA polymerase sigma factor (sigma-70 family)
VSRVVARYGRSLMRVAQQWSFSADDALDAYQRALEIYVRRLRSVDATTEYQWLKVVVRNEAIAVRRQRSEAVAVEEVDLDSHAAERQRPVDDLLAGRERVERSAEALRRLKPDEAKALMLRAQGLSYREIAESLGWTYTKVNRCVTEGRARFLAVFAGIEAGEECERFAPTLAALVEGTASTASVLELRPHLRNCPACRATVRELHGSRSG